MNESVFSLSPWHEEHEVIFAVRPEVYFRTSYTYLKKKGIQGGDSRAVGQHPFKRTYVSMFVFHNSHYMLLSLHVVSSSQNDITTGQGKAINNIVLSYTLNLKLSS